MPLDRNKECECGCGESFAQRQWNQRFKNHRHHDAHHNK